MSVEENKAMVRRVFEEAFNKGDMSIVDEIISPNYVYHGPMGMEFKGSEGLKQMLTIYHTAFPDIQATIEDIFAEGDMVAVRSTMSGTFKGEMMGIAPTGKNLTITGIVISHFVGGKEVEAWGSMDTLAMFQQLGVTPPSQ